jgi:hypothetical protein
LKNINQKNSADDPENLENKLSLVDTLQRLLEEEKQRPEIEKEFEFGIFHITEAEKASKLAQEILYV